MNYQKLFTLVIFLIIIFMIIVVGIEDENIKIKAQEVTDDQIKEEVIIPLKEFVNPSADPYLTLDNETAREWEFAVYDDGRYGGHHSGLDFDGPDYTEVYAIYTGEVVAIQDSSSVGGCIVIKHEGPFYIPARNEEISRGKEDKNYEYQYEEEIVSGIYSVYIHVNPRKNELNELIELNEGDKVETGELIGYYTPSKEMSEMYSHLHLEIRSLDTTRREDGSWFTLNEANSYGYFNDPQDMVDAGLYNPRDFVPIPKSLKGPKILAPGHDNPPGESISTVTPTFYWEEVKVAESYAFAIRDLTEDEIVYNPQGLTGTSHPIPQKILNKGSEYRWNMQAIDDDDRKSSVSNTLYFHIEAANDLDSETGLNFDFDKDTGTITDYNIEGGNNVIIPSKIDGVIVKVIGDAAFRDKKLSSVKIPDSVVEIERSAFNTNNLKSVVIPVSVEEIGMSAFTNNNLRKININNSNVNFIKYAFPEGFKEVYEENNQSAGSYVYKNDQWIKEIEINKAGKNVNDSEDLIIAVESLQKKVLEKIKQDVEFTSFAFYEVKSYRKNKIWSDIFSVPLKIFQGTLSIFSEIHTLKDLKDYTNTQEIIADSGLKIYTIAQIVHGVKDAGETLGYSWNLPYISKIEKMLEEADNADSILVESDEKDYMATIERYLNGDGEISVVPVPRKSTDIPRETVGYSDGVLEVYSEIGDTFLRLEKFINENKIENDLKKELIADMKNLETQIVDAMAENTKIIYPIYKDGKIDSYEVYLGVPAENNKLLGTLAKNLAENLKIKQEIEMKSMADTFNDAVNLYSSKLEIDNEVFEILQKTYSIEGISLDSHLKTNPDLEKMFYELPQKNLLSLPTELSILWMVVEDFDNYIRKRVLANKTDSVVENNKNDQEIEENDLEDTESKTSNNNLNPAVAVIMDVSGSMDSQSKLGSAKKAIKSFIDSQNEEYYVSLASYSTSGKSIVDPISIARGEDELRRGIDFLSASGDTNIGSGLTVGLNQLYYLNNNSENSRMILLSDGRHNTGNLWPVVEECSEKRIKVDTVAFGSDADYDTLYKIANMTGGRALKAGNKNLSYIYHRISNQIQNYSTLFASKDFIKPGQELNYLVNVDPGIETLKFYTNWQGSRILMEFTDPDGNKITPDKNSAKYVEEETYNIYEIEAKPGQWEMNIIGRDLPAQGEQVNVSVSGKSSFYTNFLTFQPQYSPGSGVMIGIEVDKVKGLSRIPLDNVKVKAKIHKPSVAIAKKSGNTIEISLGGLFKAATQKKEEEITLYDDGNHNDYRKDDGIFANVFSKTNEKGPYMVTGFIEGELEDGQKIKRQIFETFQVGPIDENELTTSQMTEEIFKSFIPFE